MPAQPTPYPDVNAVLQELLAGAQSALGSNFLGLYLYGSLASGDFEPKTSDIDFVVATAEPPPDEQVAALEAMHARLAAGGAKWAAKLEGAYIPRQALRRYDPGAAPCPSINEGSFRVGGFGSDWVIQRHILREHGVAVAGPPPATLIDPVGPGEIRRAVQETLEEWWAPMLQHPERLRGGEYQAYAILTMCRALYTLVRGGIVSKPAAARWAQTELGEQWAAAIERALAWRHGAPADMFDAALGLIGYTLERSRRFEPPANEAMIGGLHMRRLAISSWTIHGQLQGQLELLGVPAQIAKRGIHALEICHFHFPSTTPEYLAELRRACQAAGVEIYSVLIDGGDIVSPDLERRAADLEMIRGWIDVAAGLGAGRVRIVAGMQPPTPETIELSARNLRELARYAAARGVKTITENWHTTALQPQALLEILERCAGAVGLCADLGNAEGPDKYVSLKALLPHASSIHFKARYTADQQIEPVDFARCVELIDSAGFQGAITLIYNETDREWAAVEQLAEALQPLVLQGQAG
jgi:sugar phosphate isomerase/epimerase